MKARCIYTLEVADAVTARRIVINNMQDRRISDYRILRVQRCNLAHPDYCENFGYKVYVEYEES